MAGGVFSKGKQLCLVFPLVSKRNTNTVFLICTQRKKGYNFAAKSIKNDSEMKHYSQLTLLLAATMLTACGTKEGKDDNRQEAVKVEVTEVRTTSGGDACRFSGTVEEETGTLLSFAVPGTIKTMNVDEGDRVAKGQLIATLDTEQLTSNHNAARSALAQAEDAYRRMKELYDKGSLPEIKWVDAQTTLERARAAEQVAAKQLRDCRLYAPFSGVISKKAAEKGQNVAEGTAIAKLVAVGRVKVKIAVPENEIAQVSVGQKAAVTVSALGGETISGTVSEKGISADPLSRSYDVKISVDNPSRKLMPGMVATVSLEGKGQRLACVIPAHIVQIDEQNNEFVWLAAGGKAVKRIVKCGDFTANGVTIVSGLADGDRIITSGQQKISNGTEVKF